MLGRMSQVLVEEAPHGVQRALVILDTTKRNEHLKRQHARIVAQITAKTSWYGASSAWALGWWLVGRLTYFGGFFPPPATALTAWMVTGPALSTANNQTAGSGDNSFVGKPPSGPSAAQPVGNTGGSGSGPYGSDDLGQGSGNSGSNAERNTNLPNRPFNVTAGFIDRERSNRSSVLLMDQAGELFIQQGRTPPLIRRRDHYNGRITSGVDVENLVDSICATLRTIVAASVTGIPSLAVSSDDIKVVLVDVFQRILTSQNARASTEMAWSCPLRALHGDAVGWVKYVIQADSSHESYCLSAKQELDFDFQIYAYAFPSMHDLEEVYNDALKRCQNG